MAKGDKSGTLAAAEAAGKQKHATVTVPPLDAKGERVAVRSDELMAEGDVEGAITWRAIIRSGRRRGRARR